MYPINGKFFIESTERPDKAVYVVNQGATWRTFTQYGDAEAYAKRMNLEQNSVTILEIRPVLELDQVDDKCLECKGTGCKRSSHHIPRDCPSCGGTGRKKGT